MRRFRNGRPSSPRAQSTAQRGAPLKQEIPVSALKGLGVFFENDLYVLAHFLLKMDDAKDAAANAQNNETHGKSRYTVHGLVSTYSMIARTNLNHIEPDFERYGIPLGATIEYDDDVT
ncbi:MAG: hypothetical protein KGJ80_15245 [Chloroflexota bacterium]|nr:hypothetical protein [Chloroflexota bacterium]